MTRAIPGDVIKGKGGFFYVMVPVPGRKHLRWVNTGSKDHNEAKALVESSGAERLCHLQQANALTQQTLALVLAGRKVRYFEILKEWEAWVGRRYAPSTVAAYRQQLQLLIDSFELAEVPVSMITSNVLDAWVNSGETSLSLAIIRQASCASFIGFATGAGYIVGNPMASVAVNAAKFTVSQIEPKKIPPMPEECYQAALACALWPEQWYRDALVLAWCCGLRMIDCCKLEFASLTPTGMIVYPRKSRRSERRIELPLSDPLIARPELLELHTRIRNMPVEDPVWVWPRIAVFYDDPNMRVLMARRFRRLFTKLGYEVSIHSARVSFARRWRDAGKPIEEIQSMMGHGSPWQTQGYLGKKT